MEYSREGPDKDEADGEPDHGSDGDGKKEEEAHLEFLQYVRKGVDEFVIEMENDGDRRSEMPDDDGQAQEGSKDKAFHPAFRIVLFQFEHLLFFSSTSGALSSVCVSS